MAFDRKTIWIAVSLFAVLVLAAANWAATKEATWPTDWHELVTCDPSDKRFMLLQVVGELPPLKLTALRNYPDTGIGVNGEIPEDIGVA